MRKRLARGARLPWRTSLPVLGGVAAFVMHGMGAADIFDTDRGLAPARWVHRRIVPLRQDLSPFRLLVREPLDALSFKKCLSRVSEVSLHAVLRLG